MKFSLVFSLSLLLSASLSAYAGDDLKSLSSTGLSLRAAQDIAYMAKSCGLGYVATGVEGVVALIPGGSLGVKYVARHWDDGSYGQALDERTASVQGTEIDANKPGAWWAGAVAGGVLTPVGVILDGGFKELLANDSEAMRGAYAIVIENYDSYVVSPESKCGQAYADFKSVSDEKKSRSWHVAQFFKRVGTEMASVHPAQ